MTHRKLKDVTKKEKKEKRVVWFARGNGVSRIGPFDTQLLATNAIRLALPSDTVTTRTMLGILPKAHASTESFPPDAFVWPEEVL